MSAQPADMLALRILTPERVLYDGSAGWVQVPLEDGLLGIYPGHAPLVASIIAGSIAYLGPEGEAQIEVGRGAVVIDETHCVLLFGRAGESAVDGDREILVSEMLEVLTEVMGEEEPEGLSGGAA